MALIQINIIHCPKRDRPKGLALTVAWNYPYFLGIIRLLTKVSRQALRLASVGFVFMFTLLKRGRIHKQIEEYIIYKKTNDHLSYLEDFRLHTKVKDITEITPQHVDEFFRQSRSNFTALKFMQAMRGFAHYHEKICIINYRAIRDDGIYLDYVGKIDTIEPMKAPKRRVGRPLTNMALIKKVKFLKDEGGLTYRAIGLVIKRDVKQVYLMYNYPLIEEVLAK